MYCDVNPVIVYILVEKKPQTRGSATDVEQITLFSPGDLVYQPRHFLGSEMRLGIIEVLFIPEVLLIGRDCVPGAASGHRVLAPRWVVHVISKAPLGSFAWHRSDTAKTARYQDLPR